MLLPGQGWNLGRWPNEPFELNRASPQAQGLVAWWPGLACTGTNFLREIVTGNDCTFSGNPTWGLDGMLGWGYIPDTNDRFPLTRNVQFANLTPFSIAIWCRTAATLSDFSSLFGNGLAAGVYTRALYSVPSNGPFAADDANTSATWLNDALAANTTYHLVLINDGTNSSNCYWIVNGATQLVKKTITGSTWTIAQLGNIGGTGNWGWAGPIFDFRIYNRALSAAVIWGMAHDKKWDLYRPLRRWWALRAVVVVPDAMSILTIGDSFVYAVALNDAAVGRLAISDAKVTNLALSDSSGANDG